MKTDRKIAMVANHVKMEDEDALDVAFWLKRPVSERIAEVYRLRSNYYDYASSSISAQKIQKVVHIRKL